MSMDSGEFNRKVYLVDKRVTLLPGQWAKMRDAGFTFMSLDRCPHTRGTAHKTKKVHVTSSRARKAQRAARRINRRAS